MGNIGECQTVARGHSPRELNRHPVFPHQGTTTKCDIFLAGIQASLTGGKNGNGSQLLRTKLGGLVGSHRVLGQYIIWFLWTQDSGLG